MKKLISLILLCCMLAVLLAGCHLQPVPYLAHTDRTPNPAECDSADVQQFDRNLYGMLVDAHGRVLENIALTVTGSVREESDGSGVYTLGFCYPEDTFYQALFYSPVNAAEDAQSPYCCVVGLGQRKGENDVLLCYVGVDLQNQYMIVDWNDDADVYLIVSADHTADAAQLWQHFQGFIEKCPDEWPEVSIG